MSKGFDVYHYCQALSRSSCLSDQVIGWSGRWSVLGSFVICSQCLATQQIEDAATPFTHLEQCDAGGSPDYPWHELAELLIRLPARRSSN